MSDKRNEAIDAAIASIERQFGKGAIMRYGDTDLPQIEAISTGSLGLDIALGIGGVPKGRVIEIFGAEASGKTTLALQIIAQAQRNGGAAAFVDGCARGLAPARDDAGLCACCTSLSINNKSCTCTCSLRHYYVELLASSNRR